MRNPWEEIGLSDYENHMQLESVMQLQTMNDMMKEQFYQYHTKTIMVLGIAGGNGLEHINSQLIDNVFGVDVNEQYLKQCAERYPQLKGILKLLRIDLTNDITSLPHTDLVVANLLVEYIGYACFQKVIRKIIPQYVSCVIQINTDAGFVSDSPYLHAFDHLDSVHHQMHEQGLSEAMESIDYHMVLKKEVLLPNEKKLIRFDFKR